MNPKMTLEDAAHCVGQSQAWVYSELKARNLPFSSSETTFYFDHATAYQFFRFMFAPKVVTFQILKGGTGKTSLAFECGIRANLYGAKVLCVDLDQQANLTQAFDRTAEEVPVMVDILADGYAIEDSIIPIRDGLDLLPSRIENALLDEVIRNKNLPLKTIYRDLLQSLKSYYDLIIVDCPPCFGQSVAAAALASDLVLAPVTPEKFALSGLDATCRSLAELGEEFQRDIPLRVILNKWDESSVHSAKIDEWLSQHSQYHECLLDHMIRLSAAFQNASLHIGSIFDSVVACSAKQDIDKLVRIILGLQGLSTSRPTLSQKVLQKKPVLTL